jgi:hypothetical protein
VREELDGLARTIDSARQSLAHVEEERDELERELGALERAAREQESDLVLARKALGVVTAENMDSLVLRGTPKRPEARARVYWDWDEWYCYLEAEGLGATPGAIYALWLFTEDGNVVPVGTFEADAKGKATFLAPVPHDVGHVVRAGVSLEPDLDLGPKPRGEVVLASSA